MISVCVYCGKNKTKALEACASCDSVPASHQDTIHSIILCYSETEPYLNFLSIEDLEEIRTKIMEGVLFSIEPAVFKAAEEAFSAVKLTTGPKLLQGLSNRSTPILVIVLITFFVTIFF